MKPLISLCISFLLITSVASAAEWNATQERWLLTSVEYDDMQSSDTYNYYNNYSRFYTYEDLNLSKVLLDKLAYANISITFWKRRASMCENGTAPEALIIHTTTQENLEKAINATGIAVVLPVVEMPTYIDREVVKIVEVQTANIDNAHLLSVKKTMQRLMNVMKFLVVIIVILLIIITYLLREALPYLSVLRRLKDIIDDPDEEEITQEGLDSTHEQNVEEQFATQGAEDMFPAEGPPAKSGEEPDELAKLYGNHFNPGRDVVPTLKGQTTIGDYNGVIGGHEL